MRLPAAVLTIALGATACAGVPNLGAPPALRSAETLTSAESLAGTPANWPAADWWRGFGDGQLDALIAEGLAGSPDVTLAAARVRAAEALARQAGAALGPRASLETFAGGNKQSENLGIPPQFIPDGIQDTGRISGSLSFDLDLWGKNRAALRAARGEAEAARVDAEQARLMLTTGIAAAYADLSQYEASRDVARDALEARQATARLTGQRVQAGLETRGSLSAAESRVPQARADILALDEAILLTRHRIAALIGKGPDRGLAIARPALTGLPRGIPAEAGIALVGRRPDIVAARLRAEAAGERIRVAKADFYPNISLSLIGGLQSLGLGQLFQGGSSYGTGGAAITLPLFDGGRVDGRYRGARAEFDTAVARYDQTLLAALRETADALASRNAAEARLAEARAASAAAADASNVAALRYRAGLSNQLQLLITNDSLLAARRAEAEAKARRIALDVALVRALGGGFSTPTQITGAR